MRVKPGCLLSVFVSGINRKFMGQAEGTGIKLPLRRTLLRLDSLCGFSHQVGLPVPCSFV